MDEATYLRNTKMLHQICAEQTGIVLTATSQKERDDAEQTYLIAFKGLIKLIAKNDTCRFDRIQSSRTSETEINQKEKAPNQTTI